MHRHHNGPERDANKQHDEVQANENSATWEHEKLKPRPALSSWR